MTQQDKPNATEPVKEPSDDLTKGMNLGERIAHVGGRTNAQGYIEFGSPMAVNVLIQHVLRDLATNGEEGAFQASYRIPGGEWSSWGHVVCGVKGHEQRLRYLPDSRQPATSAEPLAWIHEDELPDGYPYDAMYPYSKVDVVRMFPVFAPQPAEPVKEPSDPELIKFAAANEFLLFCDEDEFVQIARALLARYQGVQHADYELSSQLESLYRENHRLRTAMQKIMSRLTELLDEDQFANIESIVMGAGVEPPAQPAASAAVAIVSKPVSADSDDLELFWISKPTKALVERLGIKAGDFLYAAPVAAQPSVPPAKSVPDHNFKGDVDEAAYAAGWNDCRSAMLAHVDDLVKKHGQALHQDGVVAAEKHGCHGGDGATLPDELVKQDTGSHEQREK